MDVVLATHGPGIAQSLRDPVERARDVRSLLPDESRWAEVSQRGGGEHRAGPRAEVLRCHVLVGDTAQVLVDVTRVDPLLEAIGVYVL